jgi:hypothetical protein
MSPYKHHVHKKLSAMSYYILELKWRCSINVTKIDIWPSAYIKALKKVKLEEYAWQRNQIHYNDNKWICEDLHIFASDNNFGIPENGISRAFDFNKDIKDFSLVLAQLILKLGLMLFESISESTNKLNHEKEMLLNFINDKDRHPIYSQATNLF